MKQGLRKLRNAFDLSAYIDGLIASAIGEPQEQTPLHIQSAMVIRQCAHTVTVYTPSHILEFARLVPALADHVKGCRFDDAPYLQSLTESLRDAAEKIVIDENPAGNFNLDKSLLVDLRELADMIQPHQHELCVILGLIDTTQMFCQNYRIVTKPEHPSLIGREDFLPTGYN